MTEQVRTEWNRLSPGEAEVVRNLKAEGKEIFAAPIEIEENAESRERQFASLGITWKDVRTWHVGSVPVSVYLTPADEATYRRQVAYLRRKYAAESRGRRCDIPGKRKAFIRCPDGNRCDRCPFPDARRPAELSLDGMEESLPDGGGIRQADARVTWGEILPVLDAADPDIARVLVLMEVLGMSAAEAACELATTVERVYLLRKKARAIGRKYRDG